MSLESPLQTDRAAVATDGQAAGIKLTTVRSGAPRAERLLLAGILLIAAGLRFYRLGASSLWSDEGNTWALIARSFAQIAQDAAADIHPPGYYWLLKLWAMLAGADAVAMRTLSAIAGVGLVVVVFRIGGYAAAPHEAGETKSRSLSRSTRYALLAAFVVALNPLQIYYSQEARMYMLLALQIAGLFWSILAIVDAQRAGRSYRLASVGYVVCATGGLWTHYSFFVLLMAADLAYLLLWWRSRQSRANFAGRDLLRFGLLTLLAVAIFLPWLPTAVERLLDWPRQASIVPWTDAVLRVLATLSSGPMRELPELLWPWLAAAALLPLLGLIGLRHRLLFVPLLLWLLAPVGLMIGGGLFSDAFLKFLLSASAAWSLLVAASPWIAPRQAHWGEAMIALGACVWAVIVLPPYYADAAARDNYAGVARYLRAVGDPKTDLVVLNAPGQQEVWQYYDPELPVLALPDSRPPDAQTTVDQLAAAANGRRRLFALFWATDESDPDGLVEGWLDQNAFKTLESWQGNMRFVTYSMAGELDCSRQEPPVLFDRQIALAAVCQSGEQATVSAGDVLLITLRWEALVDIERGVKVSVQLLDAANQVVAQRDGEPAGGARPTSGWQVGEVVEDNHGLAIPPGTPPGVYRLIVALYDPDDGSRLQTALGDHADLGTVEVSAMQGAIPLEIVPMQHRVAARLGPVVLAGYDAYLKGAGHAPETPVMPGDLVHFTLYWQAPGVLPDGWDQDAHFELHLGEQVITAPLAGGAFPTDDWRPGEFVRGEFDLLFDGQDARPWIRLGSQEYRLSELPQP